MVKDVTTNDSDEIVEDVDPLLCDICEGVIQIDDTFIEVRKNKGIKRRKRKGYIKSEEDTYWDTETSYIHLKHATRKP